MKIAIVFRLSEELERLLVGGNVIYFPDAQTGNAESLSAFLRETLPDVLITRAIPPRDVLRKWRSFISKDAPLRVVLIGEAGDADLMVPYVDNVSWTVIDERASSTPEVEAMLACESSNHAVLVGRKPRLRDAMESAARGKDVILVGGGVVNLVTAYYLVNAGYDVTVLEAAQDPALNADWRQQGCTFGGNDARMFSLNEGRHHQFKGYQFTETTNAQFDTLVGDGGWLIHPAETHDALTRDWVGEFKRVPLWLAGRFNRDIISFNQESAPLWRDMMASAPELFRDVGFHDGLLRVYATAEQYRQALIKERQIGAVLREVELDRLAYEFPSLGDGLEAGHISGVLDVVGFSVSVQKFSRALGDFITRRGAKLHWGKSVNRVLRDNHGRVTGLQLTDKSVLKSSNYVICPGAFGNRMLAGFRSENKIAAVAGMWLTLPDRIDLRLDRPLKVSRKGFAASGAAEGANVIGGADQYGNPIIHISSGHGFLGADPTKLAPEQLFDLTRAVHETAEQYFPQQYAWASERGYLDGPARYCIRPWTPTGLGLFETTPSVNGGLMIVTGGHNTGGFAQAPSVGLAVMAALGGIHHPMHALYDPDRFGEFHAIQEESLARAEV
jgi:glycine/D-amino acid oxidase-like deaminating enzyme